MSGFTHESFRNESKEWYTPPFLFERLGLEFDLDPCAPPDGFVWTVPARQKFTADDNGLLLPWDGTVFMNPPYGTDTPRWLNKLAAHGDGIGLVFARTDTRWFHDYAIAADVLCFVKGRLNFLRPDGKPAGSPGAGSLLIAYGKENAAALQASGIGACFKGVSCHDSHASLAARCAALQDALTKLADAATIADIFLSQNPVGLMGDPVDEQQSEVIAALRSALSAATPLLTDGTTEPKGDAGE